MELMPFPLSFTICGLSTALLVNRRRALRPPVAVGVKVTSMMQDLPGSTVAPVHVSLITEKEFGFSRALLAREFTGKTPAPL